MPNTRKKAPSAAPKAGRFLRPRSDQQGHPSTPVPPSPFQINDVLDRKIQAQQGMGAAAGPNQEKGFFVNFDIEDQLEGVDQAEKGKMGEIIMRAVEATVKAAIPAVVQAVKEVCFAAMKEVVNPHLLRLQYKADEIEQSTRRENLRISGLPEADGDETEDQLIAKVCDVAEKAGVDVSERDVSTCHRLGKRGEGKVRQTIVRFAVRRRRDALYSSRFQLKGKEGCRNIYINEDLTPMRYSVLMRAKGSPLVKGVSTRNGNVICKMTNDEIKTITSPDGLFDVGIDDIDYEKFKLHFLA